MIDLVFTIGGLVFAVGLLPACLNPKTRMPLRTSLPTAIVLWVYGITFVCMGLPFSALSSYVTAAMWTFIAMDRRVGDMRTMR